ncbi:hypothetical protein MMC22_007717, partial [Lobaria immixta]|nr:hypothetical protein [Lobaria immixta]
MKQLQLEFENDNNSEEFEVEDIWDSAVYAQESEDGRLPGLYYLVHWKDTPSSEDTWEPYVGIKHLRRLIQTFHQDHPQKPTATSDPIDTGPPSPPFAKKSSFSFTTLDPDPSPVSNDISTKSCPTGLKEMLLQGRSRRGRWRSGNDSVASKVAHRRKAKLASRKRARAE